MSSPAQEGEDTGGGRADGGGPDPNQLLQQQQLQQQQQQQRQQQQVDSITFGGQVVLATPNNLPQVKRAFSLVLSAVQQMRDRIKGDEEKHKQPQGSGHGVQDRGSKEREESSKS